MPAYTYVLVRTDLPDAQVAVQACHAAMASQRAFGRDDAPHPHLVLCGVEGEKVLTQEFERLKALGVPCCSWNEDDLDDSLTAVATAPLEGKQRRAMKRHRLLSFVACRQPPRCAGEELTSRTAAGPVLPCPA